MLQNGQHFILDGVSSKDLVDGTLNLFRLVCFAIFVETCSPDLYSITVDKRIRNFKNAQFSRFPRSIFSKLTQIADPQRQDPQHQSTMLAIKHSEVFPPFKVRTNHALEKKISDLPRSRPLLFSQNLYGQHHRDHRVKLKQPLATGLNECSNGNGLS